MRTPLILVTGATGTVGKEVVKQLVAGRQRVRALVRAPAKAAQFGNAVEIVQGDLAKPKTLAAAFADVDKAFVLANGPELATLEANAFDAARRAGVTYIVKLSGRHVDADFMAGTALAQGHNESERRLRTLGVAWTILRPGLFASNVLMWRIKEQGGLFLPVGDGKDTPTDPRDIAAVAVKVLSTPGHEGKVYEPTGPEQLSYAEMVQKVAVAIDKPLQFVDVPEATAHKGMLAAGVAPAQATSLLRYFAGVKAGQAYPPTPTVAELLGRPARSFDEWLRDNIVALND
jgi:uncharacterized protein YbjT (DUF2867 family)